MACDTQIIRAVAREQKGVPHEVTYRVIRRFLKMSRDVVMRGEELQLKNLFVLKLSRRRGRINGGIHAGQEKDMVIVTARKSSSLKKDFLRTVARETFLRNAAGRID